MAKQDTSTGLKQEEFSKIFDDYRAKIEEITRRAEKNLRSYDATTDHADTDENERIEVVPARSQPEATINRSVQIHVETIPPPPPQPVRIPEGIKDRTDVERPAAREPEAILNEARREAKQIVEKAEESAKKEAKKKTQGQIDKILEKARKEAEEIIAQANRNAEKVRDEVIAESKQEADRIIRDITEKYRKDTEAQAARVILEAQEKAGKMLADICASTTQIGLFITEIVTRAKKTISELETNLQTEAAELTKIVTETQARLEAVSQPAKESKPMPAPPKQAMETITNPTLVVRLIGEKSSSNNGSGALFCGQMEMKSVSVSFDYQYLKKLKKYLVHVPNIKYLQEYASEKEMSVLFDVIEPLPVLDILKNIPMVGELITRADDDICLVFKNIE